jgi:hypothetical protein
MRRVPRWCPSCLLALALAQPAAADTPAREQPANDVPQLDLATDSGALRLSADLLEVEGLVEHAADGHLVATGHVRLQLGALELRAPRLDFTRGRRHATLDGGVVGIDGPALLTAQRLELDLDSRTLTLTEGAFRLARGIGANALLAALAADVDPATLGRTQLLLRASSLRRAAADTLVARELWLTTCDCAAGQEPILSATAAEARIRPGDQADLWWVALRLLGVPVLPLPYLPLPLAARRSGLLLPSLILSGPGGLGAEVPVFIAISDSVDLTLRPRWLLGTAASRAGEAGVSGPGLPAELRWAPVVDGFGTLRLDHQLDLSPAGSGAPGAVRGHRFALALAHSQPLPGGRVVLDAEALSDAGYLRDTSPVLERARLPYLRSRAALNLADGTRGLAFESTALQVLPNDRTRFDRLPAALAPLARLVGYQAFALGPVRLDAQGSVALETPTPGLSLAADATRAARLVSALSLAQSWAVLRGAGTSLVLEAGERADALVGAGGIVTQRLGGFAGVRGQLRAEKELGDGWTHELGPAVHLRALGSTGSAAYGTPRVAPAATPASLQSELDAALPAGAGVQLVARLENTLRRGGFVPLSIGLEHHPALLPFGPGQLRVATDSMLGPAEELGRLALSAAWDLAAARVASAGASWHGALLVPGARLRLGGAWLDGFSDDQFQRPIDALFVPALAIAPSAPLVQGDAVLDYVAATGLTLRAAAAVSHAGGATLQQYTGTVSWDLGGCARAWASLGWNSGRPGAPPFGGFGIELGDVSSAISSVSAMISSASAASID